MYWWAIAGSKVSSGHTRRQHYDKLDYADIQPVRYRDCQILELVFAIPDHPWVDGWTEPMFELQ